MVFPRFLPGGIIGILAFQARAFEKRQNIRIQETGFRSQEA